VEVITLDALTLFAATAALGKIGHALSVILGLGMVIFFHELGHFAVAKWCDVHVERFSIGIGPIIWSRQKGETEYALSALPFGGYVKMLGQDDMDPNQMTSDEIAENPRSYSSKKVWQRMAIISAGVIMNVITGAIFFAMAYRMGVIELSPMVGTVHPGSPAWEAGIKDGDVITSINGDQIENFTDINQAVVLSNGAIAVEARQPDGSSFNAVIEPKRGKTVRIIGIGPAGTTRLSAEIEDPKLITMSGLPSEKASEPFLPGDQIVAVNGKPVSYLHDMANITAGLASEEITYSIERPVDLKDKEAGTTKVAISVPPQNMKSIGLWMAIGPITSIVKGSLAETQGLKVGDQIIKVGELEVSKDIDPLRLPNYFADHAGETVEVTVNRPQDGDGNETVTLKITPSDEPGWSEQPLSITAPLPIPAIGAGIHILPRIAHIVPGSEAATSGAKFAVGQKITKVELQHPDPKNIVPDIMGDKAAPAIIDLELLSVDEESPGEPNWAYVFGDIQRVPNRQVRLYVADSADGSGDFAHLFESKEIVDDWFVPLRGIGGWEQETRLRRAESFGEAVGLGIRYTKSSGINIYMTLRSLFQRNLSPRALSGPLGIVKIGYAVADQGIPKLLMFLGFLSINLAVLNFLPIPVLDGGHMVFLIWEAVARRKPSHRVINFAHGIGLIFIISLFVFVLYLDIFVNGIGSAG
jgi:regulator of sigma E protease